MARASAASAFRPVARPQMMMPAAMWAIRSYSSANGLTREVVEKRIVDVLASFDKIADPAKITPTATFSKDLDLDSLDTVEILVAIEEEFNIEIPDATADEIKSVDQAVEYILAQSEAS
ncbi:uncharacterized protein SAPINGB_P000280 [Magnusiomyces paraingens]|uniref:Acyl carrier protein n=1 Tax=Magnusiomyces paraingens TaxID=2606893 RepID=A0A5E8AYL9_9ASCO|nr:uncharacterized protein SAPINGB_P000280 [Saprochaete ingens]VVT44056.1 unnamed protein product [Saprochaete ingens]